MAEQMNCCTCCGEPLGSLPLNWQLEAPASNLRGLERLRRVRMINGELCVIDRRDHFIHGVLQIPIIDHDERFTFGVWTSLSGANFKRIIGLWKTPGRETMIEPVFGWLSVKVPLYPSTLNLKTSVITQPVGERPMIVIFDDEDHPLARDQREGITLERAHAISKALLERNARSS